MKKYIISLLTGVMALSLTACGADKPDQAVVTGAPAAESGQSDNSGPGTDSSPAGLANPWVDTTAEEASSLIPNLFTALEGATDVTWSRTEGDEPLIQMSFKLDGLDLTARAQSTGDTAEDISGLYYDWAVESDVTLAGWAGGQMPAKLYRYAGSGEYADLCTWYDFETGVSYSLGTVAEDLSGFDIQAVAEAIYDYEADNMTSDTAALEEHMPLDISSCTSFKQITDMLRSGSGFIKTTISDTEVLLVTEYVFDIDGGGHYAATDADIYYMGDDGLPKYAGYVSAGGTAYPLSIADGKLYVGANPYMKKMVLMAGGIVADEEASVEYGTDGSETYYLRSDTHATAADENGQVPDSTTLETFYEEYEAADTILFTMVE